NPTQHGVRVAEIVHSVAPAARLVLVNYHTRDQFVAAVNWIISQHIPIVNHSNSFLTPPYNDTGFPSKAIDRAARNGVLWVNSARSFGLRPWAGMFVDRNGNARNDFGGDDAMPLPGAQGQPLFFVLSWSSGSVKAGYAMLVQRQTGSGWTTVYDAEPDHGEA